LLIINKQRFMDNKVFESILKVYPTEANLPADARKILQIARQQLPNAYAPYSKFRVASALQLEDGTIVTGTNQENIAYPSGLCAERVAIFSAGSQYPNTAPSIIAITAKSEKGTVTHPLTSCGACLQVMAEYEQRFGKQLQIVLAGETGEVYMADGVKQFLPWAFASDLV
jgi:cytidine deaminase